MTFKVFFRELREVQHTFLGGFAINEELHLALPRHSCHGDIVPLIVVNGVPEVFGVTYPAGVKVKDTVAHPQGFRSFVIGARAAGFCENYAGTRAARFYPRRPGEIGVEVKTHRILDFNEVGFVRVKFKGIADFPCDLFQRAVDSAIAIASPVYHSLILNVVRIKTPIADEAILNDLRGEVCCKR